MDRAAHLNHLQLRCDDRLYRSRSNLQKESLCTQADSRLRDRISPCGPIVQISPLSPSPGSCYMRATHTSTSCRLADLARAQASDASPRACSRALVCTIYLSRHSGLLNFEGKGYKMLGKALRENIERKGYKISRESFEQHGTTSILSLKLHSSWEWQQQYWCQCRAISRRLVHASLETQQQMMESWTAAGAAYGGWPSKEVLARHGNIGNSAALDNFRCPGSVPCPGQPELAYKGKSSALVTGFVLAEGTHQTRCLSWQGLLHAYTILYRDACV